MKRMSLTSRKSHTKKVFRMKNRWWQRVWHENSPRRRWSLAFGRSAHYCTQNSGTCKHSKVTKKSVPHEKFAEKLPRRRCSLAFGCSAHYCTQDSGVCKHSKVTKKSIPHEKFAGGSAFRTKNRRGGADRSPSAALCIIVPKTLACANVKQYQPNGIY